MKNISAVVLLAVTFFCPDTALAQRQTTHIETPLPVGGTATATAAPAPLQDLLDRISALETALAAETVARFNADVLLVTVVMQHMDLLEHFSRDGDDIFITEANLHIVNGTGSTEGLVNGLGNVIVGYNESRTDPSIVPDDRTGSHMVVVGAENNYSSFGGIVVGVRNSTSGTYSSVTGGFHNVASGLTSSVSGGFDNTATGLFSSISGGEKNTASGDRSSVSGGVNNTASGGWSSASGGISNEASGFSSSISGGRNNTATGLFSSISGGEQNTASGGWSSVGGGQENLATGDYSSISGGFQRMVTGIYDWMAGMLFQDF